MENGGVFVKKIIIAALAAAVAFSIFFYLLLQAAPPPQPVFAPQRYGSAALVIDAGHGGEDGGAVSLSGASESAVNLAVARRLDLILGLYGVPVTMLRTQDVSLHSPDAETLRQKKVSDLHNRVDAINAAENAVLISIHQNSFPQQRYSGAQVFYAPTEGSQPFAEYTQEVLRVSLDESNQRSATQIPDSVYLMNHIDCPAILVECGFLSNPAEDQLLQTPEYQLMLAVSLAGSYLQYQQMIRE